MNRQQRRAFQRATQKGITQLESGHAERVAGAARLQEDLEARRRAETLEFLEMMVEFASSEPPDTS